MYRIQYETGPYVSFYGLKIVTTWKLLVIVGAVLQESVTVTTYEFCVVGVVRCRAQRVRVRVRIARANENIGHATEVSYFFESIL